MSTDAVPTPSSFPSAVATGADGSVWFTNVVEPSTSAITLQLARVGTGQGPLLTARINGTARVGSRLRCSSGASFVPQTPGLVRCEVANSDQRALQVLSAVSHPVRVVAVDGGMKELVKLVEGLFVPVQSCFSRASATTA